MLLSKVKGLFEKTILDYGIYANKFVILYFKDVSLLLLVGLLNALFMIHLKLPALKCCR